MSDGLEMFDIFDESGHKTGEVLSRKEAHSRELWHGLVFVWVYNNAGEVILQKRSSDRQSYPDLWDVSAGGHPSAGETAEEGAVKEAKEELNLTISKDQLEYAGEGKDVHELKRGGLHKAFYKLYLVHYSSNDASLQPQQSEVSAIEWRPAAQILEDRKDPEKAKEYTGRDTQIYEKALTEIIVRIQP